MPVLELTTIGRISAKPRSVMLTSPYREGDIQVVVASKGGEDTHPDWYLNLQANPEVLVTSKDTNDEPMTARAATDSERNRIWPIISNNYANYANYQKRTDRVIPIVFLEPSN